MNIFMHAFVDYLPLLLALVLLLPAMVIDVSFHRIPNLLSLGGFLAAVLMHGILSGWAGLYMAAAAGGLLLFLTMSLYLLGWMGAGDVKLMAAAGAIAGSFSLAIWTLVAVVFAGAVMALAVLAWRRRLALLLPHLFASVVFGASAYQPICTGPGVVNTSRQLPYAVAITAGSLLVLIANLEFTI